MNFFKKLFTGSSVTPQPETKKATPKPIVPSEPTVRDQILSLINIEPSCREDIKYVGKRPEIFNTTKYRGWGNSIAVDSHFKCHGHMTPSPRKGDLIMAHMTSGKFCFYVITGIENCKDPADMFFGTITPLGYFNNTPENVKLYEKMEFETASPAGGAFIR